MGKIFSRNYSKESRILLTNLAEFLEILKELLKIRDFSTNFGVFFQNFEQNQRMDAKFLRLKLSKHSNKRTFEKFP